MRLLTLASLWATMSIGFGTTSVFLGKLTDKHNPVEAAWFILCLISSAEMLALMVERGVI